jgi:hypothetical protein
LQKQHEVKILADAPQVAQSAPRSSFFIEKFSTFKYVGLQ